jgi:hypothetical protein
MNLEDKIRYERESTALDFKLEQYKKPQYLSFTKDILAMANANVAGSRFIIIGVEDKGDKKEIVGMQEKMDDAAIFQQIVHEYIEPDIDLSYELFEMDGMKFGVFEISKCDNQPYMMKKDYSYPGKDTVGLKKGDMYIRKGTTQMRMSRRDIDHIIEQRTSARYYSDALNIVFEESGTTELLFTLPQKVEFPSERAKALILEELASRGEEPTTFDEALKESMNRFLNVAGNPYKQMTIKELNSELASLKKTYVDLDYRFFFNKFGKKINFLLCNRGTQYIEDATVRIYLDHQNSKLLVKDIMPEYPGPRSGGASFVTSIMQPPSLNLTEVSSINGTFIITHEIGDIKHHFSLAMFTDPPVIAISYALKDQTIPVQIEIVGRNLKAPIKKELHIKVEVAKV